MRVGDMIVLSRIMNASPFVEKLRELRRALKQGYSRSEIEILLHLYSKPEASATVREIQGCWGYWGELGEKELLNIIRSMSDVKCDGKFSPMHWSTTKLVLNDGARYELDRLIEPFLASERLSLRSNWRHEMSQKALPSHILTARIAQ